MLMNEYYTEPTRWYHTYLHAVSVAEASSLWAKELGFSKSQCDTCYIAGIWHDAVYVPGAKDNEELSAQALLQLHPWATESANIVRKTTVEHHISDEITWDNDPLTCLVLDADLLSLAAPYNEFLQHQMNIAREHNLEEVTISHTAFLSKFLEKKSIFRSPLASDYEAFAINNITRLINTVQQMSIQVNKVN